MPYCRHCGNQVTEDSAFCTACGQPCGVQPVTPPTSGADDSLFDKLTGTVNRFAGGSGAVRPPLKKLFGKIFVKHTREEGEEIFACGTATTTPPLSLENTVWPQPWLFSRVMLAFAVAFFMLHICCSTLENLNAFPGLLVVGSFMVPLATFVFFFELNSPKNISFFTAVKVFLVGGCASLLFTLLLFEIVPVEELDYTGAILVGIIEELGKLAIVAYFIYSEKDVTYRVNGLLIGAAVGAGFAAFESAGYAFRILLDAGYDAMIDNIFLRGVLAPGGHVVWAAIAGYGIMLVKGDGPFSMQFLSSSQFWKVFWMPIAMHAVWDMPIEIGQEIALVQFILVVLSWIIIFVLINNCLGEISQILRQQTTEPEPEPVIQE